MYSNDSDDVLCCPYNKCHRIPSTRFQRHLVKCEKNFPPDYKVICPYNATHRFSKSEIVEHITTCPMRRTVEGSYIQHTSTRRVGAGQDDSMTDYNSYWASEEEA
ncbi:PREDICTED: gametocyte-specific factor 1-like [Vollenhovia emeryi]|uniref:gametocyte-specific factor 1-like n=1 Tax=Vollenhovia emeryi TaxID=411798 RepID=UPI0005F3C9CB|nr:PREDICTED: gametocyte-specific factor 1-like [Vollenhovia emeryi]